MGRIESRGDVVAVAVSRAKGVGERAEVEPVAEEMFQHRHACGAAVLEHVGGDAESLDSCSQQKRHCTVK